MGNCVSLANEDAALADQVRAASPTRAARQRSSMGGGMDTSAHRRTTHSRSAALMDLSASAKEGAAMLLRRGNTDGEDSWASYSPHHPRTSAPRSTRTSPYSTEEGPGHSPRARTSRATTTTTTTTTCRISPLGAQLAVAAASGCMPYAAHDTAAAAGMMAGGARSSAPHQCGPGSQLVVRTSEPQARSSLQERVHWPSEPGRSELRESRNLEDTVSGPVLPAHSVTCCSCSHAALNGSCCTPTPRAHSLAVAAVMHRQASPSPRGALVAGTSYRFNPSGGEPSVASAELMTQSEMAQTAHSAMVLATQPGSSALAVNLAGQSASAVPVAGREQGNRQQVLRTHTQTGATAQFAQELDSTTGPNDFYSGLAASGSEAGRQTSEMGVSTCSSTSIPLRVRVPCEHQPHPAAVMGSSGGGGGAHASTSVSAAMGISHGPGSPGASAAGMAVQVSLGSMHAMSAPAVRSRLGLETHRSHPHLLGGMTMAAAIAPVRPPHQAVLPEAPAAAAPAGAAGSPPSPPATSVTFDLVPRTPSAVLPTPRSTSGPDTHIGSSDTSERTDPAGTVAAQGSSTTEGQGGSVAATLLAKPWATRSCTKSVGGWSVDLESSGSKAASGSVNSGGSPGFFRVAGTLPRRARSTQGGGPPRRGTSTGGYASSVGGASRRAGGWPMSRSSSQSGAALGMGMGGRSVRSSSGGAAGALLAALPDLGVQDAPFNLYDDDDHLHLEQEIRSADQEGSLREVLERFERLPRLSAGGESESEGDELGWDIPPLADSAMPSPVGSARASPVGLLAGLAMPLLPSSSTGMPVPLVSALSAARRGREQGLDECSSGGVGGAAGRPCRPVRRLDSASQLQVERPSPTDMGRGADAAGDELGGAGLHITECMGDGADADLWSRALLPAAAHMAKPEPGDGATSGACVPDAQGQLPAGVVGDSAEQEQQGTAAAGAGARHIARLRSCGRTMSLSDWAGGRRSSCGTATSAGPSPSLTHQSHQQQQHVQLSLLQELQAGAGYAAGYEEDESGLGCSVQNAPPLEQQPGSFVPMLQAAHGLQAWGSTAAFGAGSGSVAGAGARGMSGTHHTDEDSGYCMPSDFEASTEEPADEASGAGMHEGRHACASAADPCTGGWAGNHPWPCACQHHFGSTPSLSAEAAGLPAAASPPGFLVGPSPFMQQGPGVATTAAAGGAATPNSALSPASSQGQHPALHRLLSARVQSSPHMAAASLPERATWAGVHSSSAHPAGHMSPGMVKGMQAGDRASAGQCMMGSSPVAFNGISPLSGSSLPLVLGAPWPCGPGMPMGCSPPGRTASGLATQQAGRTSRASHAGSNLATSPTGGGAWIVQPLARWASASTVNLGAGAAGVGSVARSSCSSRPGAPARAASLSTMAVPGQPGTLRTMLSDAAVSDATAQAAASKVMAVTLELQTAQMAMAVAAACGESVPELAAQAVSGSLSHLQAELSYDQGSSVTEGDPLMFESSASMQHSSWQHGTLQQRPSQRALSQQQSSDGLVSPSGRDACRGSGSGSACAPWGGNGNFGGAARGMSGGGMSRGTSGEGAGSMPMVPVGGSTRGRVSGNLMYDEPAGSSSMFGQTQSVRGRSSSRGHVAITSSASASGPLMGLDLAPVVGSAAPGLQRTVSDTPRAVLWSAAGAAPEAAAPCDPLITASTVQHCGPGAQASTLGVSRGACFVELAPAAAGQAQGVKLTHLLPASSAVSYSPEPVPAAGSPMAAGVRRLAYSPSAPVGQLGALRASCTESGSSIGGRLAAMLSPRSSWSPAHARPRTQSPAPARDAAAGGGGSAGRLSSSGRQIGTTAPHAGSPPPPQATLRSSAPTGTIWPSPFAQVRSSMPGNLGQAPYEYSAGAGVPPGGAGCTPHHPAAARPLPPRLSLPHRDEHEALALSFFHPARTSPRGPAAAAAATTAASVVIAAASPTSTGMMDGGGGLAWGCAAWRGTAAGEVRGGRSSAPGWIGTPTRSVTRYALDQVPEGEVSSGGDASLNASYHRVPDSSSAGRE